MTQPFRIALAGLGTVGTGVVRILQTHGELLAERAGCRLEIAAVSARSRGKNRGLDISGYDWSDDPVALARRDDIDCLVEVIGGEDGPAKAAIETALSAGMNVVTANKALLAHHGQALAERAEAHGAALRFEAAVAGGIPVVKALMEGLAGNRLTRVMGVMNGTCNYILTEMLRTGADYAQVLEAAQQLGYAEADPAFDVGGIDAAHKLALLAALAFGTRVDFAGVRVEGIDHLTLPDLQRAADMGYRVKLLGVARLDGTALEQRVQPCLVPADTAIGQLDGVTNAVVLEGDFIGQVTLEGPGAGEGPTASAILADIVDIASGLRRPVFGRPADRLIDAAAPAATPPAQYCVRLTLEDRAGCWAEVAAVLGRHGVSIDRMQQYAHDGPGAPVVIVTHPTADAVLDAALDEIAGLAVSLARPVALRIEAL
ncbi:MAG: homoserine dehydrogenase [Alphaproteobacteria bacterium]|nr:MAG: homoserine dehydrogenase [Alphaproteobacteria bacterium]